ncbi:hypothetical protein FG379_003709 [Cryptosporidium bovis]|uniref:uncharacterized protein n=1 Tax=Cryptosporidium bovis TaxID=310047 RepID=UPI00351A3EC9|nr:hypothetical protein FG379_003709 [Cryptosporidium bovis]
MEYSNNCNFVYEYNTEKYKYRVYRIDPFDRFLWKEQSESEKEKIRLKRNRLNIGNYNNNVRISDRGRRNRIAGNKEDEKEKNSYYYYFNEDDDLFWEFELPSKLSIVVVCICSLNGINMSICYSNVKWYKTVRGRLIESEFNSGSSNNRRYLTNNELRDATMYGMLLSTLFTAGIDNNVNVPNDENEHIFDNKLDIRKNSINDLDYLKRIYLWPSYCEYNRIKELSIGINVNNNNNNNNNSVLILNGCPVGGVNMTILINKTGHLIFSISNKNWNVSGVGESSNGVNQGSKISLKCMVKMYNVPQSMETQNCITKNNIEKSSPLALKSQNSSLKQQYWDNYVLDDGSEVKVSNLNKIAKKDEIMNAGAWDKRRWGDNKESSNDVIITKNNGGDYYNVDKLANGSLGARKLILMDEYNANGINYRSFDSNVKRNELINIQPNINGVRSQITGKSMVSTPKVGRESITGGSGDKSYLLFNRQFQDRNSGFDGNGGELKATVQSTSNNVYNRSLPSEPMIHAIFQNVLWRDWLIRYAPLVRESGHFVRVGNNFGSGFIGESYVEEAVTLGLSYDKTILSVLSGKNIPQLGRFITFGYTDGLYGVRIDRSTTINAWGVDLQARYFLTSTLASFGLREYAEHITVRDISLSARHNFSQKDILVGQQFSTEVSLF